MRPIEGVLSTYTDAQLSDLKSLDFTRWVSCLCVCQSPYDAADRFVSRWPASLHVAQVRKHAHELISKSAVNPGTVADPAWAAPLAAIKPMAAGFIELNNRTTVLGRLMPYAQRVPFQTSVPIRMSGGTFKWIGEGSSKPVGNMAFRSVSLGVKKAGGVLAVSQELAKLEMPGSDVAMRDAMNSDLADYLDQQFCDPAITATSERPASITNQSPSIGSVGTDATAAKKDFQALLGAFLQANPRARAIALLTTPGTAVAYANALTATTCGWNGGVLNGVTVITGNTGPRAIMLDPTALVLADSGEIAVSVSTQATLEYQDAPTSPLSAAVVLVNLWQANLIGLRAERFLNYQLAKANAVVYLTQTYQ
ncbi:MAG TPA: phage major capsid protein [Vicinamibacterales bacterium]|jgi:hypothetical protein